MSSKDLDAAFERRLIDSASGDSAPAGARKAAWLRFSATLVATAALPGASKPLLPAPSSGRTGLLTAAKWLVIGAVAGSSLTAVWLRASHSPQHIAVQSGAPTARVQPDSAEPSVHEQPLSAAEAATEPRAQEVRRRDTSEPDRVNDESGTVRARRGSLKRTATRSLLAPELPSAPTESNLGREVSLLDRARKASLAGAFSDAVRQIEQYHREFPDGELAADAEVIAIDALDAAQRKTELVQRAARFLSRYPGDPHAPHVQSLAPAP